MNCSLLSLHDNNNTKKKKEGEENVNIAFRKSAVEVLSQILSRLHRFFLFLFCLLFLHVSSSSCAYLNCRSLVRFGCHYEAYQCPRCHRWRGCRWPVPSQLPHTAHLHHHHHYYHRCSRLAPSYSEARSFLQATGQPRHQPLALPHGTSAQGLEHVGVQP